MNVTYYLNTIPPMQQPGLPGTTTANVPGDGMTAAQRYLEAIS